MKNNIDNVVLMAHSAVYGFLTPDQEMALHERLKSDKEYLQDFNVHFEREREHYELNLQRIATQVEVEPITSSGNRFKLRNWLSFGATIAAAITLFIWVYYPREPLPTPPIVPPPPPGSIEVTPPIIGIDDSLAVSGAKPNREKRFGIVQDKDLLVFEQAESEFRQLIECSDTTIYMAIEPEESPCARIKKESDQIRADYKAVTLHLRGRAEKPRIFLYEAPKRKGYVYRAMFLVRDTASVEAGKKIDFSPYYDVYDAVAKLHNLNYTKLREQNRLYNIDVYEQLNKDKNKIILLEPASLEETQFYFQNRKN